MMEDFDCLFCSKRLSVKVFNKHMNDGHQMTKNTPINFLLLIHFLNSNEKQRIIEHVNRKNVGVIPTKKNYLYFPRSG